MKNFTHVCTHRVQLDTTKVASYFAAVDAIKTHVFKIEQGTELTPGEMRVVIDFGRWYEDRRFSRAPFLAIDMNTGFSILFSKKNEGDL